MPSPTLCPRTKRAYESAVRLYILPSIGDVKLSGLGAANLRRMYTAMTGRGLGRTVVNTHRVLHSALEQAKRDRALHENPARDFFENNKSARPELDDSGGAALEEEEVWKLLEVAEPTRWHGLLTVAIFSQARLGELLGLRWKDVDLDAATMNVRQQLDTVTKTFGKPKSNAGRRCIALPTLCVEALRTHKARQNAERLAAGEAWRSDLDLVFATGKAGKGRNGPTQPGSPLTDTCVRRALSGLLEEAGLPRITFHGLRHTGCTLLASQPDVTAAVLMKRMGHGDVRLTLQRYNHVSTKQDKEVADVLDRIAQKRRTA